MTITVLPELVENQRLGISSGVITATRVFIVTTDAGESIGEILQAPSIPARWSEHPDFNTGGTAYYPIYALDFDVELVAGENAIYKVTVGYSQPDATQVEPSTEPEAAIIQVASTVSSAKTNKDKDGNQIIVTLGTLDDQTGEVDIQSPETVISFQRRESVSPFAKSLANTGKVNSATCGTLAIGTLLCLGIEGESTDNGVTWPVTYRFQYRPATFTATVVYIDPETDKPHKDVVLATNTGVVDVDVYGEVDFNDLDLPWDSF